MSVLGLLLGVVLLQAKADQPRLELRASTLQPYIGQEITLRLDIFLPANATATPVLAIPWRSREFGFNWSTPPEQWLAERAAAKDGLALSLPADMATIRAAALPPEPGSPTPRYRLTWRLILNEPDTLQRGAVVFAPVRMTLGQAETASNAVSLERRKLPLMPPDLPALFLGVGDYRLDLELPAKPAALDAEMGLKVRVTGKGALGRVPRPAPRELWEPGANPDFRLEAGAERLDGDAKLFSYTLRPRRPGSLALPVIRYACFDPELDRYVARSAGPWTLQVLPGATVSASAGPSIYPPDAIPDRLQPVPVPASAFIEPNAWSPYFWGAVVLAVPPAFWLYLWLTRFRRFPDVWLSEARRRTQAARHAEKALHKLGRQATAEDVLEVLVRYLHVRFGLLSGEPTPAEVEACLCEAGVEQPMAFAASDVLDKFAEERFGAPRYGRILPGALVFRALAVIQALEKAAPC
jgi:hypothetical protein